MYKLFVMFSEYTLNALIYGHLIPVIFNIFAVT